MTPVDDLKVGDWVAIVACRNDVFEEQYSGYAGDPMKIVAISLPFIALHDGKRTNGLDIRHYNVKKVSRKYVDAMTQGREKKRKKTRSRKDESSHLCPNCHIPMTKRLLLEAGKSSTWVWTCPDCNQQGDPVPAETS